MQNSSQLECLILMIVLGFDIYIHYEVSESILLGKKNSVLQEVYIVMPLSNNMGNFELLESQECTLCLDVFYRQLQHLSQILPLATRGHWLQWLKKESLKVFFVHLLSVLLTLKSYLIISYVHCDFVIFTLRALFTRNFLLKQKSLVEFWVLLPPWECALRITTVQDLTGKVSCLQESILEESRSVGDSLIQGKEEIKQWKKKQKYMAPSLIKGKRRT